MEIKCTVEELKELIKEKRTSVAVTTDEIPRHNFTLFNAKGCQHICMEAQQEVPKEEKN